MNKAKIIWEKLKASRPYRTFSRFTDVGGNVLTAGMSFQALFAVFASLWVGFGIAASWLRSRPELVETIADLINTYVPGLIAVDGSGAVPLQELLDRSNFTLSSAIGSIALIWVAMNWFTGTRRTIRLIFGLEVKEYKNAVLLKIRDFLGTVTFFVAILLSAVLTVLGSGFFSWLLETIGFSTDSWLVGWLGLSLRLGAMFVVDVLILMGIHRFLAEVKIPRRRLLAGASLGALGLFVLKTLGTLALGGASSNPLLATFAVVVGLLVWFNLLCRVLLLTSSWIATGIYPEMGKPETPTVQP